MGNNDSQLAGNPGKENIRFCGSMVSRFPSGDVHVNFQVVDGTFHNSSDFIKGISILRNPSEYRETYGNTSFRIYKWNVLFCGTTRIIKVTRPLPFGIRHS